MALTQRAGLLFAALAVAASALAAEDAEGKLDLALKLVERAQRPGIPGRAVDPGEALVPLRRLRRGAAGQPEAPEPRLSVLVKHEGSAADLQRAGLRVQSCLGSICTGTLPLERLATLAEVPGVRSIQSAQALRALSSPANAPSLQAPARPFDSPSPDAGGTGVLVAFIDTGVDIRHHDFRRADGTTRIKFLLDLSDPGDVDQDGDLDGTGPYGGTLYTEADINATLAGGTTVREKDTTGHGTHGLSIAAGDEAPSGAAPAADLLVVKATRDDETLGFVSTDVVNALAFVNQKAKELARPLVVNLSLGTIVASHDGRSLEEQALDQMAGPGIPGRVAVVAAGNSSDNRTSRFRHLHDRALVGLPRGHSLTVPAYTANPGQGDDRILLDLWYRGRDRLTLRVTSPGGTTVSAAYGRYADVETPDGNVFIANLGGASVENGDVEAMVLMDDWAGTAPSPGTWTLSVEAEEVGDTGEYHGWLSDDSTVGAAVPWLSANADNRWLVGKPGTAFNAIAVGSDAWHDPASRFRTSWVDVHGIARVDSTALTGQISDFSSPGPTRDGRLKPDLVAPGERVLGAVSHDAYPGIAASSVYRYHGFPEPDALLTSNAVDRGYGLLQGTSFSAPVVTGLAARVLSASPTLDAIQVRNILLNATTPDVFTGPVPNDTWGWGKLHLGLGSGVSPLPSNLRVETASLPLAFLDEPFDFVLSASGGKLPYTWSLSAGALPTGLSLDAHGFVSGTPSAPGTYDLTVEVSDSSLPPQSVTRTLTLVVSSARPLEIVTPVLAPARLGRDYSEGLEARGGTPPYAWSLAGGTLPPGLALSASGRVSGSPSEVGRYSFTVRVQDAGAAQQLRAVGLRVSLSGTELWDPLGRAFTSVNQVAIDPNDAAHLYCSTSNGFDATQEAVFESTDAGGSWRTISVNNNLNDSAQRLAVSPTTSVPWVITARNQYVMSYDRPSGSWAYSSACTQFASEQSPLEIDGEGRLHVVCPFTGVLQRSSGAGSSWQPLGTLCGGALQGNQVNYLSVHRANPLYMYATRSSPNMDATSYACRSTNGGATWTAIGTLSASFADYVDILVSQASPLDVVRGVGESFTQSVERSLDGGNTWTKHLVTTGGLHCCMARAASDPAVLLYGTTVGVFRSADGGQNWSRLSVQGQTSFEVTSVAIDPADASSLWVGSELGLFHSADGGLTWDQRNRGLVRRGSTGLAVGPASTDDIVLTTTEGPYLSRTGGGTWVLSRGFMAGLDVNMPVLSAADPSLYYVNQELGGLYRSDNRGISWTALTVPSSWEAHVQALDADPFDADNVIVGLVDTDEIYRSIDRGATWTKVTVTTGVAYPRDFSYARDVPGRLYLGLGLQGVWRSEDGGATWAAFGMNQNKDISIVAPAPSNSEYVYAYDPTGRHLLFRDPAVGTWRAATTEPLQTVTSIAVDGTDPRVAWAGVSHPGGAGQVSGVFRTADGGRTWTRLPGVLDAYTVMTVAAHAGKPGVLFAATREGGAFRSPDGGTTWTPLDKYGTVADLVNVTVKHPSVPLLLAGTEGYGVQVSADGGRTFEARVSGLANLNVNALAFDSGSATLVYAATDAGVFKSTDTGNTWAPTGLTGGEVTDLVTDNVGTARRIWGTVRGQGVAYSANGGATFSLYSSGLASLELTSLELETIGTARRIWGTTRGGDGVVWSDDLGETWASAAGSGLTDRNVNDFTIETGAARRIWGTARRIWGTTDSGVFYSDDNGLSWSELSLGLPGGVPVSSVSIDPRTNEVLVSLFSGTEGGVYRGANLNGTWRPFNDGLDALKVRRVTNDGGRTVDATTTATTFYAATAGDGAYVNELRNRAATAPLIATSSLPAGRARVAYSATLAASGGTPPYAWSIPEGFLPTGLALAPATGVVSGAPGQLGAFSFSVQVADALGRLDRRPLSIIVTDSRPDVSAADVSLTEGQSGTKDAVFAVSLSFASDAAVTVAYATANGTATAGADYAARSGLLTFPAGSLTQAVRVPVTGDRDREGNETFFLDLTAPTGTLLGRARAQATIVDDESGGRDFNGDGSSDLLWHHQVTGELYAWLLSGTVAANGSYLTPRFFSDTQWQIRGLADIDGDGKVDVLWHHQVTGDLYVWFLDGTVTVRGSYLTPKSFADTRWQIRGTGDFDGDGHPDLLWHHQDMGDLYVWFLDGTVTVRGSYLTPKTFADTRWQIRGLADFNQDGQLDLLWHHQGTGDLYVWFLNGTVTGAGSYLTPKSFADTRWKIVSVADFDGDGQQDLLWHHQGNGELYVWFLNGTVTVRGSYLTPSRFADTNWKVVPR